MVQSDTGQKRAVSATLCCQQNLTRDTRACARLSPSICIVGESSWLSILHLVDACACLLSKQPLFTCIFQACFFFFFPRLWQDYWKQKLMGVVAVCLCKSEEVKAAGPTLRSPLGVPHEGPLGAKLQADNQVRDWQRREPDWQ